MASIGRPVDPVDPTASPWHLLGAQLRHWREYRDETLESLGAKVHVDPSLLGKYERGQRKPTTDTVQRLDDTLNAGNLLTALHTGLVANTSKQDSPEPPPHQHADTMNHLRRQLLAGIALGAAAALPLDGLTRLREIVDDRVGAAGIADWNELAWEYAHQIIIRPIHDLISDLSVDLLALQKAMTDATGDPVRWARVNTQMTSLLAYALGSAGQARESRHWWASARRAALRAGDEMLALVCAFEAVQALYEDRPLQIVVARAEEALAATAGRPCVATAKALSARANARALLGDPNGAYADLDEQARVFERLPGQVTGDYASIWGWPVTRILYSRSLVYTVARHPGAGQAQAEAIAAYPESGKRQAAQVRLHAAMTAVGSGDVGDGLSHARAVLADLGQHNMTRYVLHTAASVVDALPPAQQADPGVTEYRAMLALSAGSV